MFHFGGNQPASYKKKSDYQIEKGRLLGTGGTSVVKKAYWKKGKKWVALKVIDKRSIENLPSFVDTLLYQEALKHPHIIEQYDHFESKERYYVSMEVCDGGELFDRVLELGHFEEEEARSFLERFLSAIEYCHKNSVVHRDIKPENVLYRNRTDYNDFVLMDFGFSSFNTTTEPLTTVCGTPGYCAPEVYLRKGYHMPADIYSLGILTYAVLSGCMPWLETSIVGMIRATLQNKIEFPESQWTGISDQAKHFILCCCQTWPEDRPTASQALQHPWIQSAKEQAAKAKKHKPSDLRHKGTSTLKRMPSIGPDAPGRRITTEHVEGLLNDMERNPDTNEAGKILVLKQAELRARVTTRTVTA